MRLSHHDRRALILQTCDIGDPLRVKQPVASPVDQKTVGRAVVRDATQPMHEAFGLDVDVLEETRIVPRLDFEVVISILGHPDWPLGGALASSLEIRYKSAKLVIRNTSNARSDHGFDLVLHKSHHAGTKGNRTREKSLRDPEIERRPAHACASL